MVYLYPIIISTALFLLANIGKWYEKHLRKALEKFALFIGAMSFILLVSLRWETGFDWEPYHNYFKALTNSKFYVRGGFEPLFCAITYVIAQITQNYNAYLFIISSSALLVFFSISDLVPKEGSKLLAFIATYMTILPFYMGGLRQSLAIAISSLGLASMAKNKKVISFLLFAFATAFHVSAVLNFVYLFIFRKNALSRRNLLMLLLISLSPVILYLVLSSLSGYGSFILKKIDTYIGYGGVSEEINYQKRDTLLIAERLFFLIVFTLIGRRKNFTFENRVSYFLVYCFSTVFYISAMFTFRNLAGRGIIYFRPAEIVLISLIPSDLSNILVKRSLSFIVPSKILFTLILYCYLVARFIVVVLMSNAMFYLPYKSIL